MTQLAKIDPDVKIPDAVKASAARADEAFKAQYETEAQEENGVQETQQEAPATGTEAPLTSTAEATTQEVTVSTQSKSVKAEDDQSWEHRYKSMKGRYDRAETQIRALSDQISGLQNVIATLQTAPQQFTQDDATEYATSRLITPEEEKDYGSEFLTVVGKKAKEELSPEVAQLRKEIAGLKSQLNGVGNYVAGNARERMEVMMNDQVPNWRDVNVNQEFLNWLKLPDAYSGAIRHDLLKVAYERNDAPRVLAFFKGFLAEEAATTPAERGPDIPDGASVQAKVSLESLAAPGRAKTAAASAPAEKPYFTRAQISKFYADSASGRYRGKEAEKDRIERQIFEAEREGRIR
jgi:hypothetical protein